MATHTENPANTGNMASESLILALHARYEKAWSEYTLVDKLRPSGPTPDVGDGLERQAYYRSKRGLADNFAETQLLRDTICFQVPHTDEELAVIAHHAWTMSDPDAELSESDKAAMEQALTSMFDYLVSEGRADQDKLGKQFATNAKLAFHRRRYRTGLIAED